MDIPKLRLHNQQISVQQFTTPKDLVSWMGAMQAQDYTMAKWAIGLRVPDSTNSTIETALNNGEILRTHVLRPTWHIIPAADIRWMLKLTAPGIIASMRSRDRDLELTEEVYSRSLNIVSKALENSGHLTKDDLQAELEKNNVRTGEYRGAHILMRAELIGLVCSGILSGKKQTWALLDERAPKVNDISREEALAKLGLRYFTSHGPATIKDFSWWSGLTLSDSRKAVEMNSSELMSEEIGSEKYWFKDMPDIPAVKNSVHLLPAFDEYLISYRDRSAVLTIVHHKKAVSNNGIFRPVVVVDGQVAGLWKRSTKGSRLVVETNLFEKYNKRILKILETKIKEYELFASF